MNNRALGLRRHSTCKVARELLGKNKGCRGPLPIGRSECILALGPKASRFDHPILSLLPHERLTARPSSMHTLATAPSRTQCSAGFEDVHGSWPVSGIDRKQGMDEIPSGP